MKISLVIICLLAAQISNANCLGEAQIIAKVGGIHSKSLSSCKVFIDTSSIVVYNENLLCPLDINQILELGIEVGLKNGHDCAMDNGDAINGVLYIKYPGQIVLE